MVHCAIGRIEAVPEQRHNFITALPGTVKGYGALNAKPGNWAESTARATGVNFTKNYILG